MLVLSGGIKKVQGAQSEAEIDRGVNNAHHFYSVFRAQANHITFTEAQTEEDLHVAVGLLQNPFAGIFLARGAIDLEEREMMVISRKLTLSNSISYQQNVLRILSKLLKEIFSKVLQCSWGNLRITSVND